jgi:hypothetical protein
LSGDFKDIEHLLDCWVVVNALNNSDRRRIWIYQPGRELRSVKEELDLELDQDWEEVPEGLGEWNNLDDAPSQRKNEHALGELDVP